MSTPQQRADDMLRADQERRRGIHSAYCRCRICKPPCGPARPPQRFGRLCAVIVTLVALWALWGAVR